VKYFLETQLRQTNNISIPGRYTRLEFENKVRSSAEKLTHLVDSLDVNPEEKRRFSTFLVHEVINYMKHYQDYYAKFFHSCDIQNVSLDGMKKILKDLTHETSSFHDFLNFIQYQTGAFSEPIITLKNVSELNHFDFLNRILTRNGGEAPFAEYQKIMKQLLADLESESAQGNHFQMVLSPFLTNAARISSDILQNNSRSYVHRVKECLTNLNVPERYHAVFLKPVLQVNKLGLIDLKKGVENAWAQKFQSKIDSILSKFPFNLNETEIVSYEELDKVLNPRGEFYKTIMELMMACGGINEGKWSLADAEKIQINENIFASLNKLQSITDLLWDKEGNPQPINLYIKAVPFTHTPQENPVIVYSYLVVGEQCVRNLNQTPTWQNIKIDWWKDETCSVGVELMDKYKNVKSFKSIQKLNSKWGFFELLKDSVVEEGNILTWKLTGENESQACQVSLCFERDPHVLLLSQN
jgi:type VI protein secretion system component VasK